MPTDNAAAEFEFTVADEEQGERLDIFLTRHVESLSRSQLRRAITDGFATSDGRVVKPAARLQSGQVIRFRPPPPAPSGVVGEDIPLDVLFEDNHLIVIDKPPGMVVHPSVGHWQGTLASALVYRFDQLSDSGGAHRPGIVHRLDRDTSGCIVVAKDNQAHAHISAQFAARTVAKTYLAIVVGRPDRDRDLIRQPIGPHPRQREKMAIRSGHPLSRDAESFYEVVERFDRFSLLKVMPRTGRTHQIRVHLAHLGYPVACDTLYGHTSVLSSRELSLGGPDVVVLQRQALHASTLTIAHPVTNEPLTFLAELPTDMATVLDSLRR